MENMPIWLIILKWIGLGLVLVFTGKVLARVISQDIIKHIFGKDKK